MRYGSGNRFLEFLRHGGRLNTLITLLAVGILLIVFGTATTLEKEEKSGEQELAQMCSSLSGVGECRVMISYDGGRVIAVAVVCEGGDIPIVKERVCDLVSSLYGIGYNRITVHKISPDAGGD